ncbi:hypothetical protein AB205_0126630 [Aquarana catesbeiana]|uniref:Exportin-5 C-terminal domain-containing protein n=1 Tax=Aquarana catesbeiana TaxID=8400 RepID=A0A2G9RRC6_AQUCT|nr:hypothetical protein AB205_0126630 [Aquarana catesbeiana]
MGESYAKCLDMMEMDKKFILGLIQPVMDTGDVPVYRSAEERMQGFFRSIYESCCQVMGKLGQAMLQDFYSIPDLATRLLNSAFCNLSNVPDYRLRAMLYMFMKPFILSCPPERYESLLCPIMGPLLSFMNQRLSQKWLTSGEDYGEVNTESSEMLEIELARLVTRDMVDLLATCCVAKKTSEQSTNKTEANGLRGVNQAEAEADEEMMSLEVPSPGSQELTKLGKFLMSSEVSADPGDVLPFTDQCLQPTCLDGHTGLSESRYSAVLAPAKTGDFRFSALRSCSLFLYKYSAQSSDTRSGRSL